MKRALQFRTRLLLVGMGLSAILFLAFHSAYRSAEEAAILDGWVGRTHEVLSVISTLRLERPRLRNDLWEYRSTHNPDLPVRFQEDLRNMREGLARLQSMTADDPAQQKLVAELALILGDQWRSLDLAMREAGTSRLGASSNSFDQSLLGQSSERRRQIFAELESNEQALLAQRSAAVLAEARHTRRVLLLAAALTFGILVLAGYFIQREIMLRERIEGGMRQAYELLGGKYQEKRAELGYVIEDLHAEIRARRLSEAHNRELVEHSTYGIFRASFEGAFLDANPALLAILGCGSLADLQTMNLPRDVFRYPEQFAQLIADCRARGLVHEVEAEWRRRDGGIIVVRLHLRSLSIPGYPDSVEFMAEDVTEIRALERQLRQAQKFEAVGQLAGGVAHDFNNVVGAILGWAELGIEQYRANPEVAERFARIREQADRAAALTRELLAFARRQVLQPRSIDLNSVTSSLVSFLDKVIGKDIELKVVTAPLDPVKVDPTQIEQVLMNLCLNARDAMPGGGRLLIETEMVELDDSYCHFYPYVTPGRYAVLSVSDTGIGMDSDTRERIFEPFFTTKDREKGTGMGLATAYGTIKQHGGFIHVYSEPGHGSLFRVFLPVAAGTHPEESPAKAPAPSLMEFRGSETILLAEDHESIRDMARQTLLNLGYRVLSACDGQEALRLCENEVPALAILDVVMPKLGGPAVAQKLEALFEGLPILFTSGYSPDSENVAAASRDARYLQKPYSPTTLGRVVREILDRPKNPVESH